MIRIFLFIFFIIISNKSIASIQGVALICDNDRRGYNFISTNKVEILSINFEKLNIVSSIHLYKLTENAIFIKQQAKQFSIKKDKTIGWIFRRNLDYVSLYYKDGDWSRKFLWSCELSPLKELKTRLKNKLNK